MLNNSLSLEETDKQLLKRFFAIRPYLLYEPINQITDLFEDPELKPNAELLHAVCLAFDKAVKAKLAVVSSKWFYKLTAKGRKELGS